MADNVKKFAEMLSTNEGAKKELATATAGLEHDDKKGFVDAAVKVAANHGITLSAADFEAEGELSPNEMKSVAGGCSCNGICWQYICFKYAN